VKLRVRLLDSGRALAWRLRWVRSRLTDLSALLAETDGVPSKARMLRLVVASSRPELIDPKAARAMPVKLRNLGRTVWLRPRSTDPRSVIFLGEGHHLPPRDDSIRSIAVFGANIGLPLSDLAVRYPSARLLAVEPSPENAAVLRRNVAALGDRVTVVEAAVWHEDGVLEFGWTHDAWGFNLAQNIGAEEQASRTERIRAVSADRLLSEFGAGERVDYVLITIESAWYELLRNGQWTRHVRMIRVQHSDHYDEAGALLAKWGFDAEQIRLDWGAYLLGTRADEAPAETSRSDPAN
jgi:FkbM family methyltransferase